MNKNLKIIGLSAFAMTMLATASLTAFAQVPPTAGTTTGKHMHKTGKAPTAANLAAMKAKFQAMQTKMFTQWGVTTMADLKVKMTAQRQLIQTAITNNDYQGWNSAMTQYNMQPALVAKINAGNFSQYVQMVTLLKAKNFTAAKTIADALGIKSPMGMHGKAGAGKGNWKGHTGKKVQ